MEFYLQRKVLGRMAQRLDDPKAIVLQGARQVGKTTLIRQLLAKQAEERRCTPEPLAECARTQRLAEQSGWEC